MSQRMNLFVMPHWTFDREWLDRPIPVLTDGTPLITRRDLFGSVRWLSCHLFGKELLTQLVTCNFIVYWDVFVHLSL